MKIPEISHWAESALTAAQDTVRSRFWGGPYCSEAPEGLKAHLRFTDNPDYGTGKGQIASSYGEVGENNNRVYLSSFHWEKPLESERPKKTVTVKKNGMAVTRDGVEVTKEVYLSFDERLAESNGAPLKLGKMQDLFLRMVMWASKKFDTPVDGTNAPWLEHGGWEAVAQRTHHLKE